MILPGSFRARVGTLGWTDLRGIRIQSVEPDRVVVLSALDHSYPRVGTGRVVVVGSALVLEGRFDVWTLEGRQAFDRVRSGAVRGWSISFWGAVRKEDGVSVYSGAQIYEASPSTGPLDPTTRTLEIEGCACACPAYALGA